MQPLRPDRHRQPAEQHLRVQGLQEQDANLASQVAVCGEVALPRANGHEYCTEDDGDMSKIKVFFCTFIHPYTVPANKGE